MYECKLTNKQGNVGDVKISNDLSIRIYTPEKALAGQKLPLGV